MKKVLYSMVLIVVLSVFLIGNVSCESNETNQESAIKTEEEKKVMEAWDFLLNSGVLKSPYSAHLNGYLITNDGNVVFEVDSQNGFGAFLRNKCYVIYEGGKPVYAGGY